MAFNTEHPKDIITMIAEGAVNQKRFVTFGGAQAAAGEDAIGIAYVDADDATAFAVVTSGTCFVTSGGVISVGDQIASDADGKAVVADTGDAVLATAMKAATGADEEIVVALKASPIAA